MNYSQVEQGFSTGSGPDTTAQTKGVFIYRKPGSNRTASHRGSSLWSTVGEGGIRFEEHYESPKPVQYTHYSTVILVQQRLYSSNIYSLVV